MDAIEQLNRDMLPFAKLLGIRFTSATPECGKLLAIVTQTQMVLASEPKK